VAAHAGVELGLYARDAACLVAAVVGAKVWTKLFDIAVKKGLLEQNLSRKLVHTTTGPIFLLTWPLFSAAPWARFVAAVVPALNAGRLLAVGSGVYKDDGLVKSVSRSGGREELLKGPLYYCLVLIATTLLCWRDNPVGLVVVSLMCGGDGLADIVGRRWGKGNALPYNSSKSWAGSTAMLVGGAVMAAGLMAVFCSLGFFECYSVSTLVPYLLACSAVATLVESLPINQVFDDNLSVPLVAAVMAMLLLPQAAHAAALLTAAL